MSRIDKLAKGLVLMVDEAGRLAATITDGDIRRAILRGLEVDSPISAVVAPPDKQTASPPQPITAPLQSTPDERLRKMRASSLRHLPLLDDEGRVVDIAFLEDIVTLEELPVQAVIMAGGLGTRLRPLTDDTPKPMLQIAGQPLLERTVRQLRDAGIQHINVTTHYLPEKIIEHFGDGEHFGVHMNYVAEDEPLGTAGSLALVDNDTEPLLVMNGDILTRVDFRSLVDFHRDYRADVTIGVRQYDVEVPYGVVEAINGRVYAIQEKPKCGFLVNAGIYLLEPTVKQFIPQGKRFDMPDLIGRLLQMQRTVVSFPIVEYWRDIGKHDDFERAQHDVLSMRWAA